MDKARRRAATMGILDEATFLVSTSELLVNHPETLPPLALSGAIRLGDENPQIRASAVEAENRLAAEKK